MNLTKIFGFRRRVPGSRNVLQLNKVIDKAGRAMVALNDTAAQFGIDLGPDAERIELALMDFFTDREGRDEHSAVLRGDAR